MVPLDKWNQCGGTTCLTVPPPSPPVGTRRWDRQVVPAGLGDRTRSQVVPVGLGCGTDKW